MYYQAPVSYMAEGQANKYFHDEKKQSADFDPSQVSYFIVRTCQENEQFPDIFRKPRASINESDGVGQRLKFGCRLIAVMTCSDTWGVDQMLREYDKLLTKEMETGILKSADIELPKFTQEEEANEVAEEDRPIAAPSYI